MTPTTKPTTTGAPAPPRTESSAITPEQAERFTEFFAQMISVRAANQSSPEARDALEKLAKDSRKILPSLLLLPGWGSEGD